MEWNGKRDRWTIQDDDGPGSLEGVDLLVEVETWASDGVERRREGREVR